MAEKYKKKSIAGASSTSATYREAFGMPNYRPDVPETEDDASYEAHKKTMRSLSSSKDERIIKQANQLANLTFAQRRSDILENHNVEKIVNDFPFLKSTAGLAEEFKRLSNINLQDKFTAYADEFYDSYKSLVHANKLSCVVDKSLIQSYDDQVLSSQEILRSTYSFLGSFVLCKEEFSTIIGKEIPEPRDVPIFILFKGTPKGFLNFRTFKLLCSGKELIVTPSFKDVILSFISCFWVFNIPYPKSISKTMLLFEKYILCVDYPQQNQRLLKTIRTLRMKLLDNKE